MGENFLLLPRTAETELELRTAGFLPRIPDSCPQFHGTFPKRRQNQSVPQNDRRRRGLQPDILDRQREMILNIQLILPERHRKPVDENGKQIHLPHQLRHIHFPHVRDQVKRLEILPERINQFSVQINPSVISVEVVKFEKDPFSPPLLRHGKSSLIPPGGLLSMGLFDNLQGTVLLPVMLKHHRAGTSGNSGIEPFPLLPWRAGIVVRLEHPPDTVQTERLPNSAVTASFRALRTPEFLFKGRDFHGTQDRIRRRILRQEFHAVDRLQRPQRTPLSRQFQFPLQRIVEIDPHLLPGWDQCHFQRGAQVRNIRRLKHLLPRPHAQFSGYSHGRDENFPFTAPERDQRQRCRETPVPALEAELHRPLLNPDIGERARLHFLLPVSESFRKDLGGRKRPVVDAEIIIRPLPHLCFKTVIPLFSEPDVQRSIQGECGIRPLRLLLFCRDASIDVKHHFALRNVPGKSQMGPRSGIHRPGRDNLPLIRGTDAQFKLSFRQFDQITAEFSRSSVKQPVCAVVFPLPERIDPEGNGSFPAVHGGQLVEMESGHLIVRITPQLQRLPVHPFSIARLAMDLGRSKRSSVFPDHIAVSVEGQIKARPGGSDSRKDKQRAAPPDRHCTEVSEKPIQFHQFNPPFCTVQRLGLPIQKLLDWALFRT